uniref:Uncharacterized protein n=1 Tax=Anopheles merus TaxID=30066 RepID=A0A182VDP9_ANOME
MIVTEQTTIPCDLCIERGQIELLIARRIGADLLERLQHMVRYWRLDRQMGTLRLEPVRVGIVRHPVQHTVRTGVRVLAGRIGAIVAGLLRRDAVARLLYAPLGSWFCSCARMTACDSAVPSGSGPPSRFWGAASTLHTVTAARISCWAR